VRPQNLNGQSVVRAWQAFVKQNLMKHLKPHPLTV